MAVVKAKPVAKKAAAKKPVELPVLEFEADLERETKGAFNLKEDAESREDEVCGNLYLRKLALGDVKPKRIRVTVEVLEAED